MSCAKITGEKLSEVKMDMLKGAAVVGQSGGPTAAINATLAGVIRAAINEGGGNITRLYGMRNGIDGFLADRTVNLSRIFTADDGRADEKLLGLLSSTPAAALGSCRRKLPDPDAEPALFESLIERFRAAGIRYFFYIGGNDSMDTVSKLTKYTAKCGYDMRIMGVPKTIDNDLTSTDHTPGFGSAAKYIATTVQEIIRDCAVYTVPAVTIVEIMGRDAGWLTASAALGKIISGYAPDLVYLPERAFSMKEFFEDVRSLLEKKPNVVVAVSEGLRDADGEYVGAGTQTGVADVFGHKYLSGTGKALEFAVKAEIGCKVRSVELNISQRCAAHLASLTDITESQGVAEAAVKAAVGGDTGCMMSIERTGDYKVEFVPRSIAGIANYVRCVPDEYINERGNDVTCECLKYLRPLIAGETSPEYKDGLPCHFVLEKYI